MTRQEGQVTSVDGHSGGSRHHRDAEQSELDHWRGVAARRTEALEALRQRPLVRAALRIDRRSQRSVAAARRVAGGLQRGRDRASVLGSALGRRPALGRRRADVAAVRAALTAPPTPRRSVLLLAHRPGQLVAEIDRAIADAATDLVCLVDARIEPFDAAWLDRLVTSVEAGTGVLTGPVLHAARPLARATPLDLLVREAGLEVARGPEGEPLLRFRRAGASPVPPAAGAPSEPVTAVSASCLLVDVAAFRSVGGLRPWDDLDLAVVDLCLRLRSAGWSVRCAPTPVGFDGRPVVGPAELAGPVADGDPVWRTVVADHGAALFADPGSVGPLAPRAAPPITFAVTVAAPSAKVAARWGDWHLATALAEGLERRGHEVRLQTADRADSPAGRVADVHVVVRGLVPVRRSAGQRHVLWIVSHPEAVTDAECDDADLVLVASQRFADALRDRTTTPVAVLLQATDQRRFRPVEPVEAHRHPVTVVAKSRDVLRPMVADAVAAGLRPAIYGGGWGGLVDPSLIVADHVDNADLPVVYSSAGVVLNDHWDTMRAWGFVSNRVYDVLACGAPLVSDDLPEISELFGDLVATWRSTDELAAAVATVLADPAAAATRAAAARRLVLDRHTFDHRAGELLDLLVSHELVLPGAVGPDGVGPGGGGSVA